MRLVSSTIGAYVRANAVGFLALFVAIGGTAYAVGANTLGATELKLLVVRESAHVTVAAGGTKFAFKRCRSRQQFISGAAGWVGANDGDNTPIVHSQFIGAEGNNPTGFLALARNNGTVSRQFFVEVACLRP